MYKRIRVFLFTLIILLISTSSANAISITGNPKVDWLIKEGYVTGDSNGYRLNDNITRAEATKMIVESAGLGEYVDSYKFLKSMFGDVKQSHWANGYINVAVVNTLVNGYTDGSFGPSKNITYAEVIKMLVMANGDIPDTEKYTGPIWAVPYIAKANELGITEEVEIKNYYEPAIREKVFEMVFNTMFKEEPIILEQYNGIILANKRVSKLKDEEISLLVLKDLNRGADFEPRYVENDIVEIKLPREVEDVEYLLGKVVDITIDNNNVVKEIKFDRTYSYYEGPILAGKNEVYIGATGEYYRVDLDLTVYHNDENYIYEDYVYELGERDSYGEFSFLAEFANVTVKNGRIYFIDSFTFTDIAPVSEVSRNGREIYVFDDSNDGQIRKIKITETLCYTDDWGLETLDSEEIKKGNVLHIYGKDKAIIRKDSKKAGYLYDLYEYDGYYFAEIEGYPYQVRITDYRRPIYSIDGVNFKTLIAEDIDDEFYDLIDNEVTFLLDINGHIQAILGQS